jgi:chromosome segregation ATPase
MRQQAVAHERQMAVVKKKLESTQQQLDAARLTIQEREYAIAAQRRCEEGLAGHAAALNAALAAAAADVALLFQRWDEKNELEDGNLELVQVRLSAKI